MQSNTSSIQGNWVILLLLVVIALLSFDLFGSRIGAVPKWEYRIESPSDSAFDTEMEKLGEEGWELVFARRATTSTGVTASYEMIFRRQR
jgi:hypothetical protein